MIVIATIVVYRQRPSSYSRPSLEASSSMALGLAGVRGLDVEGAAMNASLLAALDQLAIRLRA